MSHCSQGGLLSLLILYSSIQYLHIVGSILSVGLVFEPGPVENRSQPVFELTCNRCRPVLYGPVGFSVKYWNIWTGSGPSPSLRRVKTETGPDLQTLKANGKLQLTEWKWEVSLNWLQSNAWDKDLLSSMFTCGQPNLQHSVPDRCQNSSSCMAYTSNIKPCWHCKYWVN